MLQPQQLDELAARHPAEIAELRGFLGKAGVPVGSYDALHEVAARVQQDRAFRRDLTSHVWVVLHACGEAAGYADLLGMLALAAAGPEAAADAEEADAHALLRFVMQARASYAAMPVTLPPAAAQAGFAAPAVSRAQAGFVAPAVSNGFVAPAVSAAQAGFAAQRTGLPVASLAGFERSAILFDEAGSEEQPWYRRGIVVIGGAACLLLLALIGLWRSARPTTQPAAPVVATAPAAPADQPAPGVAPAAGPMKPRAGVPPPAATQPRRAATVSARGARLSRRSAARSTARSTGRATARGTAVAAVEGSTFDGSTFNGSGGNGSGGNGSGGNGSGVNGSGGKGSRVNGSGVNSSRINGSRVASAERSAVPSTAASPRRMRPSRRPSATAAEGVPTVAAVDLGNPTAPRGGSPNAVSDAAVHAATVRPTSLGIMASNVVYSPSPAYPSAASAARVQGEVKLEAEVDRDGNVVATRVISGPPLLRAATEDAVQRWRYRPYLYDGRPVAMNTEVVVDYQLP